MRITSCLMCLSKHVDRKVNHYSMFRPSSLTIQQLLDFGREGDRKSSYLFLRKEMLVRIAHSLKELDLLPQVLISMPSIGMIKNWYQNSFQEILHHENAECNNQNLANFTETLRVVLRRNVDVVQAMAEGIIELKEAHGVNVVLENSVQYFLDRFYINRISMRMLMNQHILIFGSELPLSRQSIGSIDPSCDVVSVIKDAYNNARTLSERYYQRAPELLIKTKNECDSSSTIDISCAPFLAVDKCDQITVVYVPSHLYHICFELFKNAMRATIESGNGSPNLHPIKVTIVKGREDLSIKISDKGGGVPRSTVEILFNYMYTTAPPPKDPTLPPLAGYGYGLPLSRLYARYFKGDLYITSMEGYGTDACVYLKALAVDASELLPIYSTSSKRVYENTQIQAPDWSQSPSGGSVQPRRDYRRHR